jgi:hypothetical protein
MPWLHRYVGNPVLTGILNILFWTPIRDAHCGLRGFKKSAYVAWNLTTPGMEFASEIVVRAALLEQQITEVPTTLKKDGRNRPPHLQSFRDGWRHLRLLLLASPGWLYLVPAALLFGLGAFLMIWLTPGPRRIHGEVGLDLQGMLFGALCVLVGYQTLWLWGYAKTFGWVTGFLPARRFPVRMFRILNLERGLLAGAVLFVVGVGLNAWMVHTWYLRHFLALDLNRTMRVLLWGSTTMLLGIQTVYGSFFLSMLGMSHRDRTESG